MNVAFPLRFDHRGRTAESPDERYVRELIELVLFTTPGERVMRDLGSGVAQLVFAPNSPELAGATQMLAQGALAQWLGELITVHAVEVRADDSALRVSVTYAMRGEDATREAVIERGAAP